jgi:hypothetical protein
MSSVVEPEPEPLLVQKVGTGTNYGSRTGTRYKIMC